MPQVAQQASEGLADRFLSGISNESLEVLQHFGSEAPYKLNDYACKVEDALLESLDHQVEQAKTIGGLREYVESVVPILERARDERIQMIEILSDPETLAAYTKQFFGPNGPYPVQTPGEEARANLQAGMISATGPLLPQNDARAAEFEIMGQGQYQRPAFGVPAPAAGGGYETNGGWSEFERAMQVDPASAHQILAQMTPDQIRSKVLFMEG